MVFSSIPVYLDPPNWQQQEQSYHHHQTNGTCSDHEEGTGGLVMAAEAPHMGSIRPGSMAERARQAKIAPPEAAVKCPRCESTNTKFCYFNNYSLSQPRHFCKTCRRYWTRGGALRNVPVGGGCRRNKKTKPSSCRSKSGGAPMPTHLQIIAPHHHHHHQLPPSQHHQASCNNNNNLPFMAASNMSRYGGVGSMGQSDDHHHHMFPIIGLHGNHDNNVPNGGGGGGGLDEQWRLKQLPFFNGSFDRSNPFQSEVDGSRVKMEENAALNMSRTTSSQAPTMSENNNHYYSWTPATTDIISGLPSSSTYPCPLTCTSSIN